MRITDHWAKMLAACLLISPVKLLASTGPSSDNAIAAERQIVKALLDNDANAVSQLLADDWTVTSTHGKIADRDAFLGVIKSGQFIRKTLDLSEVTARIYGNVAVVTSKVRTSGIIFGKNFDVPEQETDVLVWRKGSWKCVLTHETEILDH
jgi:ketosteroid isomerase-like protein